MVKKKISPLDEAVFRDVSSAVCPDLCGARLVENGYLYYLKKYTDKDRNRNGRIFELLIVESLRRSRIGPVYYQTEFHFVPNVAFDIMLYHPEMPVVLSCKTSLRERYKQAELEGFVLKQVYRRAQVYLITRNIKEGNSVQQKIDKQVLVGIDGCIVLNKESNDYPCQYDNLLGNLSDIDYQEASPVEPITAGHLIPLD